MTRIRLATVARSWRKGLAAGLAAAALGAAGCGEEGTIPRDDAQALLEALNEVESKVEEGDCSSAETDATQLVGAVNQLPSDVGADVKELLRAAGENLVRLTRDDCEPETGATGETTTTTEPTTTTPTTTTTTTTEEQPPEQPDDEVDPPGNSGNGPPGNEGNDGDEGDD